MLREPVWRMQDWLWRCGRLRIAVTLGLWSGIWIGAGVYLATASNGLPHGAVAATAGGVLGGALYATLMSGTPWGGGWLRIRHVSELPPSDRAVVVCAVRRGLPVSDPPLAPGVLAYAEMVLASLRWRQALPQRWIWLTLGALALVVSTLDTITDSVWHAWWSWAYAAMAFTYAWYVPWLLERHSKRAQTAADSAADLMIGRSPAD